MSSSSSSNERVSLLRQILVIGGQNGSVVTCDCVHKILQMCNNEQAVRNRIRAELQLEPKEREDLEVPEVFKAVTQKALSDRNIHYMQVVIFTFMCFDPAVFGRFMMQGEPEAKQVAFMKCVKEAVSRQITGRRMTGDALFTKTESIIERKTGVFAAHLQTQWACL